MCQCCSQSQSEPVKPASQPEQERGPSGTSARRGRHAPPCSQSLSLRQVLTTAVRERKTGKKLNFISTHPTNFLRCMSHTYFMAFTSITAWCSTLTVAAIITFGALTAAIAAAAIVTPATFLVEHVLGNPLCCKEDNEQKIFKTIHDKRQVVQPKSSIQLC